MPVEPRPGGPAEPEDLQRAVESFIERCRRGEDPSVEEYASRFPGGDARELFSALRLVEDVGRKSAGRQGASRAPEEGDRIPDAVGEYRILREIGRGGMGIVYEAEQASLGRRVALKVLPRGSAMDSSLLERFRREAQAAARLHHTNIVPVFGAGEEGGIRYYAMQYIEGRSLTEAMKEVRRLRSEPEQELLRQSSSFCLWGRRTLPHIGRNMRPPSPRRLMGAGGREANRFLLTLSLPRGEPGAAGASSLPEDWLADPSDSSTSTAGVPRYFLNIASVGLQVASALAHAHGQGILHRDIKPSNLLLDARGDVWVTDFGLVKEEGGEDLTASGDLPGTISYMAPERFRGRSDPRSDLYGLGVTLYEIATLRPAFADPDRASLVRKVLAEDPPRPRRVDRRIPRDLETIILKAIEKEPGRRYQSADDLAEDLRAFLAGKPLRTSRTTAIDRSLRWCRRNPIIAALAAAAVVLLLVAVDALFIARWSQRGEREARYWRHLSQARAHDPGGPGGQLFSSLESLEAAIRLLPELDLGSEEREQRVREIRDEIIVSETRSGIRPSGGWDPAPAAPQRDRRIIGIDDDLRLCAVGEADGGVRVFRLDDGRPALEVPGPGPPAFFAAFDAGSRHVAIQRRAGGTFPLQVRSLESGLAVLDVPGASAERAVAFHPREPLLAVGFLDGALQGFPLEGGDPRWRIALDDAAVPDRVAFRPDGEMVAVSFRSGPSNEVRLVEPGSGATVARLRHPTVVLGLAWHPAGSRLAACCEDSTIRLWDTGGARLLSTLTGHEAEVMDIAFSHRGDLIASRSWDTTLRIWDAGEPGLLATAFCGLLLTPPRFAPGDDRIFVGLEGSRLGRWDVTAGRACRTLRGHSRERKGPYNGAFVPGGRLFASLGHDGIRLWDLGTGVEVAAISLPQWEWNSVEVDPSGRWLVTNLYQGRFRWPMALEPDGPVEALRVGPPEPVPGPASTGEGGGKSALGGGGRRLAVARGDRATVIDLEGGGEVPLAGTHPGLDAIAISSDGKWVATGAWAGGRVKIWEGESGALAADLPPEGKAGVVFGPDGGRLVVCEPWSYTIREAPSWGAVGRIERENPGDLLGAAAFSPDGSVLAVSGAPCSVELLDARTLRRLATLTAQQRHLLNALAFSGDGALLAAVTAGSVVQVWDLRRIRARLAAFGVDWSLPPYPPVGEEAIRPPLRVEVIPGDLRASWLDR
jgi:serine/threonine protein kinase/WD40 repeat protein